MSTPLDTCHCQSLRQAARRVTAFYDAALAPLGLRVSQFSVLARLHRQGPRSIQALAAELVMDRTTLGRNIRPLERDGLLCAVADPADRRARLLSITPHGAERFAAVQPAWAATQAAFEARFGAEPAARLQSALQGVVTALHTPEQ
jgi:DNA-binding MarR family transcriptional regulator